MVFVLIVLVIVVICLWSQLSALRKSQAQLSSRVAELNRLLKPSVNKPAKPLLTPLSPCSAPKVVKLEPPPPEAKPAAAPLPNIEIEELPKPKPPVAPKPMPKPEPKPAAFNWEKLFMGNLFNKLGALAIIVGVGIFIKLVSPYFEFTPMRQVVSTYVLGLVLVLTAWRIHRKEMKAYAAVLMGTGFAVFFVATYGATTYYHMMPEWLALCVGLGLVIASYGVAQRFKTISTMLVGMVAAYLNPIMIGHYESIEFLFIYFIFINAITAVYVYVNSDEWLLNYINLVLSSIYLLVYASIGHDLHFAFPLMLWAVYMLSDFMSMRQGYKPHHLGLSVLNYAVLIVFALYVFSVSHTLALCGVLASLGSFYLLLAYLYRRKSESLSLVYTSSGLFALLFAPYFIEWEGVRLALWSLQAVACSWLYLERNIPHLEKWSMAFVSCAALSCLFSLMNLDDAMARSLCILIFLVGSLGSSLLLWRRQATIAYTMCFLALLQTYFYLVSELNNVAAAEQYLLNLIAVLSFVPAAMRLFVMTRYKPFALAAFGCFGLCLSSLAIALLQSWSESSESLCLLNMNCASSLVAVAVALSLAHDIKKHISAAYAQLAGGLRFIALGTVYAALAVELRHWGLSSSDELHAFVILGCTYALIAMLCYAFTRFMAFVWAGLLVYLICVIELVFKGSSFVYEGALLSLFNGMALSYVVAIGTGLMLAHELQRRFSASYRAGAQLLRFASFMLVWLLIGLETYKFVGFSELLPTYASNMFYGLLAMGFVSSARWFDRRCDFVLYRISSYLAYLFVCLHTFIVGSEFAWRGDFDFILNVGTLHYLALIALTAYLARGQKYQFFHYWAIVIGLVLVGLEATHLSLAWSEQASEVSVSVAWILYSAALMGWGIGRDVAYQKLAGTVIVIFSALKIVLYDLSRVDALSKTIAFLLLGAVLMAVSYYYTKKKKS